MADAGATTRVLDELLWTLRRGGFVISTSQAVDVARAVAATGFDDPAVVRDAIAAVVVERAAERARFDTLLDEFFARSDAARTLWERLEERGFDANELERLLE
jgi:uncharacterized protein with von Willebrand factor type A (vWA) domain